MMRSKVHLALQAVVCIALLILLSISAVEIYREDASLHRIHWGLKPVGV